MVIHCRATPATAPHSGHVPGVARKSYPHSGQHPATRRPARRRAAQNRAAGNTANVDTSAQYGTLTPRDSGP